MLDFFVINYTYLTSNDILLGGSGQDLFFSTDKLATSPVYHEIEDTLSHCLNWPLYLVITVLYMIGWSKMNKGNFT